MSFRNFKDYYPSRHHPTAALFSLRLWRGYCSGELVGCSEGSRWTEARHGAPKSDAHGWWPVTAKPGPTRWSV